MVDYLQNEAQEQDYLERQITTIRIERLHKNPIEGNFDFEHLAKIHHALFHDLYDHAGKSRPKTENWGKQLASDTSLYTEFADIDSAIAIINENSQFLIDNDFLKNLDSEDFIYEFTICYAEVNHAHPFLDGNGRATRVMFQQLAQQAGYDFILTNISQDEWNKACLLSSPHFILYEAEEGGYIGEEQEINITPLFNIFQTSLRKTT